MIMNTELMSTPVDTLTAYHGSEHCIEGNIKSSEYGTFGAGSYWGDLACAKLYASQSLVQAQFSVSRLMHCKADYTLGEQFDLETPALPLLMALYDCSGSEAAEKFIEIAHKGLLLGADVSTRVRSMGFEGILAEYEPGVFEIIWFAENIDNYRHVPVSEV